ncbi:bifunctional folylpolyglutamate synthase/dihydrofolate synthase [Cuniculiplasma divulgatum]|uniref:Folylpolyglutamate synthase/dihydrofolate synthase n=1 Tax=Cuniculiplasma divulgatum TaxID=1673428 RepID=A0A1N5VNP9_9ARCH|nr:folylpolyglutamate synthase/dihydrofolate synthase family protein [Cuniculiplasma divulgatum]SIM74563.1 folylpolyglutamate synthase/dihydrofolate synthase [Cuniculiplasma divulgatum]
MRDENLQFIYRLKREGIKYDLSTMREFDLHFGSPHKEFKSVHITGSNGKGSVSNMIFNVLRLKGKTGLYTSPHLVDFNERIFLQDRRISDEEIEHYIDLYRDYINNGRINKRNPTFFEVTTEMAFQFYRDQKAEYASIEVGLGGRLDATNILTPIVSVITRISYEHTDRLGTTLEEIAREKGGIIKQGIPVVTGEDKPEPLKAIKRIAELRSSIYLNSYEYTKVSGIKVNDTGSRIWITTPTEEYKIDLKLIGNFQVDNARTTITALESIDENISRKEVEKGLSNARWPGRMDVVRTNPLVILDSSHNPSAAQTLSRSIREIYQKKPLLVVGMLSDKDHFSYLHNISTCADDIILTTPEEPERKVDPEILKPMAEKTFRNVMVIPDPIEAYKEAIKESDFVVVTGSMYLVGAISRYLGEDMSPFRK